MTKENMIREVVGVFNNYDGMKSAIDELEISGFSRRHISVLGSEKAVEKTYCSSNVKAELLEDNPDAPRSPDIKEEEMGLGQGVLVSGGMVAGVVSAIIASGGIAVPGIVTTVIVGGVGGTVVGGVLAKLLGDKYSEFFQNQIENGGLVLWVNASKLGMEVKAEGILKEHGAKDIHVHELPVENTAESEHTSKVFGELFVKLDDLIDKNKGIFNYDKTINEKLSNLEENLKYAANSNTAIPQESLNKISNKLQETILYAKDMAEEYQRMTNENMNSGLNSESTYSDQYFSIATDLDNLEIKVQKL